LKRLLKKLLPTEAIFYLIKMRRDWRRNQWKKSVKRGDLPTISKEKLMGDLSKLGIATGTDLFVHSAMSRIGMVEGGPQTIIEALQEVIGPTGTLLFPVYPLASSMLDCMLEDAPFDVDETPSTMGKIGEVFREMPGATRSAHPTHSVAALGPRAEFYTGTHHEAGSPCGPGSPLQLLSQQANGRIVCLGSDFGKLTAVHVVEDEVDDFPVPVYLPQIYEKDVILPNGTCMRVATKVHDPHYAERRIDNFQPKEDEILAIMTKANVVTAGRVGNAQCYLIDAMGLNAEFHRLVGVGTTIYG